MKSLTVTGFLYIFPPSLRQTFVSRPRREEHSLVPQWQGGGGGGVTVREVSV